MIEYIHLNPVRHGLVPQKCDWKWSSTGWFELGNNSLVPDPISPGRAGWFEQDRGWPGLSLRSPGECRALGCTGASKTQPRPPTQRPPGLRRLSPGHPEWLIVQHEHTMSTRQIPHLPRRRQGGRRRRRHAGLRHRPPRGPAHRRLPPRRDKLTLAVDPLPRGGVALVADDESALGRGQRRPRLPGHPPSGGKPKPRRRRARRRRRSALALLADDRLAVLAGHGGRRPGPQGRQGCCRRWICPSRARASRPTRPANGWPPARPRAPSPSSTARTSPSSRSSESERLHEGAVTALLFEPEELRFFSAGADQKLLSTHARGKLEPEDKGRGNNHTDPVTALIWGPGDRFYTGSRDSTVKTWPRVGGVKPATLKDGVGKVVALALVQSTRGRTWSSAATTTRSAFFPLDAARQVRRAVAPGPRRLRLGQARVGAGRAAPPRGGPRGPGRLRRHAVDRADRRPGRQGRRPRAAAAGGPAARRVRTPAGGQAAGEVARATPDEAVRVAAFQGLRQHLGEDDLRPLDLALKAEKADVGRLAVQALEALAAKDDQALARLIEALNAQDARGPPGGPGQPGDGLPTRLARGEPDRRSARSTPTCAGWRSSGCSSGKMLREPAVQSALRRRLEDADPEVRRTAFLLSLLHARASWSQALRGRDPELHAAARRAGGAPRQRRKPPDEKAKKADAGEGAEAARAAGALRRTADLRAAAPGDGQPGARHLPARRAGPGACSATRGRSACCCS